MNTAKIGIAISAVLLLILCGFGIYWSQTPAMFSVKELADNKAQQLGTNVVTGSYTSSTLIHIGETLLKKPGGFISNDILPPGLLIDNITHWEYGALIQVRDMSRAMRDTFSRSQSQSKEDEDLSRAESRFNISHTSWAFPSAESQYKEGIDALYNYLKRLSDDQNASSQFYARADNLRSWLSIAEVRLGDLSQRLGASVGQHRININLAGDEAATQSTQQSTETLVKTPWLELDNVFYEARGSAWALIHLLRAVELDFADVLKKKNAQASLAQIIRELEASQQPMRSPMVLNGNGFGLWANHSLVMASYLSRANAALIDLRTLLEKG